MLVAITGVSLGAYNEVEVGIGCFLKDYPTGSLEKDDVECLILTHSRGLLVACLSLFPSLVDDEHEYLYRSSRRTTERNDEVFPTGQPNTTQVATQVFSGTYIWTTAIRIIESLETMPEQSLYPLLVVQAVGLPSTGIFQSTRHILETQQRFYS